MLCAAHSCCHMGTPNCSYLTRVLQSPSQHTQDFSAALPVLFAALAAPPVAHTQVLHPHTRIPECLCSPGSSVTPREPPQHLAASPPAQEERQPHPAALTQDLCLTHLTEWLLEMLSALSSFWFRYGVFHMQVHTEFWGLAS